MKRSSLSFLLPISIFCMAASLPSTHGAVTVAQFNAQGTVGTLSDWTGISGASASSLANDGFVYTGGETNAFTFTHNNWIFTNIAGVGNERDSILTGAGGGFYSNTGASGADNWLWLQDSANASGLGQISIVVNFASFGTSTLSWFSAHRAGDAINFNGVTKYMVMLDGVQAGSTFDTGPDTAFSFIQHSVDLAIPSAGNHTISFLAVENGNAFGQTTHDVLLDNFNLTAPIPEAGTTAVLGLSLCGLAVKRRRC